MPDRADETLQPIRNIVLVHGAFVDGSGWEGVYRILAAKGYKVAVVQHPTASLAEDVGYVQRAVEAQGGPVVLVGHSYGGVVITEAGRSPKVAALVYIAAWVPDEGQSVLALIKQLPAGAPPAPVLPPHDGFIVVDPARFPTAFAADVEPAKAEFMASSQAPWGVVAASAAVGEPAWATKPSWYLVAADDRMIPPQAQRTMAARAGASITEVAGSHAVFISNPGSAAGLIETAAKAAVATRGSG
jgi:pimeloyl-ACP methyl ester carboxylesterase